MTMTALLEILTSYVPTAITRRLALDPALLVEPVAEHFPAAVLFADLSGFTPLAEKLAQAGPVGAETLSHLLNDYFGQLVDIITAHGGDVVEFEGDALLALWRDETEATPNPAPPEAETTVHPRAVKRAAQCALAVQAKLHNYSPAEDITLSLRISLGAGAVVALHLGGVFGRWKLLINGSPLAQVSAITHQAEPGQVVLSPEAWALIQDQSEGLPLSPLDVESEGGARLIALYDPPPLERLGIVPLGAEAEPALRAYLPGAIIARLVPGQESSDSPARPEWLAELRRVTVLFINLPDITANTPLARIQQLMRVLQTTLYHYEGSFNKIGVSDKGATVVAACGLPPLAHEDDPVRGAQTALAVQNELKRAGLACAIGVTTGRVFTGSVGNATRREYTMIGDVVNVAARFMQTAAVEREEGGSLILCDAATFQIAQKRLNFEELGTVKVKGKAEALEVYRPLGERAAPTTQTQILKLKNQLIGRQAERMVLADQLQAILRGGQGTSIVVEGEAGIGKSRLVDELRRQATSMRLTTFILRGNPIEKATPYQVWRPVFSQMLDLEVLSDNHARQEHILNMLEVLGPELVRLAPLLNVVLPLDLPDNEHTAPMTGAARADATRALLLQILETSVMASPKVMVVEDAHWLDSASWSLTRAIAEQVHPLLLMVALRPFTDTPPAEYLHLRHLPEVQALELAPLTQEETQTLVRQRLSVSKVPDAVTDMIWAKAEGNPFFTEELAYTLRDTGMVTIVEGEARLTPGTRNLRLIGFPDTVQGVVTSRVDRLHPQLQLALKVASVIGREFSFRVLEKIYPMEAEIPKLGEYLATLEQLDLVRMEPEAHERLYLFKHAFTQEAAYNLMLFAQRRELHRKVGLAMEALFPEQLNEMLSLLATHFFRGEVWEKAIEYTMKAGDTAVRLNAFTEAHQYYSDAQECLAHLPYTYAYRRLHIDTILKQVSIAWGNKSPASNLTRLIEAESLAQSLPGPDGVAGGGDRMRLARIHFWIGREHYYGSTPDKALEYFMQVLSETSQQGNDAMLAPVSAAVAQVLLAQGQFARARKGLTQAAGLLENVGNWHEWIRATAALGVTLVATGHYAEGVNLTQQALARAKTINDLAGLTAGYLSQSMLHLQGGNPAEALVASRQAVQTAEQFGNQLYAYWAYGFQAWAEGRLKQYSAAQELWRAMQTLEHALGSDAHDKHLTYDDWFTAARAEIALQAGRADEAIELAEEAIFLTETTASIYARGLAHRVWGQALAATPGHHTASDEHLLESLTCFETGDARLELARTRLTRGLIARARGDRVSALQFFEQAAAQFKTSQLTGELNRVQRWMAETQQTARLSQPLTATKVLGEK